MKQNVAAQVSILILLSAIFLEKWLTSHRVLPVSFGTETGAQDTEFL
jgi:hypothetical protein